LQMVQLVVAWAAEWPRGRGQVPFLTHKALRCIGIIAHTLRKVFIAFGISYA